MRRVAAALTAATLLLAACGEEQPAGGALPPASPVDTEAPATTAEPPVGTEAPTTTAQPSDGPMPLGESAGPFYDVGHALVADLIGLPVAEFEEAAAERGYGPIRVVWSDGEHLDSTDDLVLGRVNVATEGRGAAEPVVVDAFVEHDLETGVAGPEATIVETYEAVEFYPACGNEILNHRGVLWHQVHQREYPEIYDRAVNGARENLPESIAPAGLARVVAPGPGDDVGTLVVWSDGVAFFVSDSGDLTAWLVTDDLEYPWVC